jgi:hypothetical protein
MQSIDVAPAMITETKSTTNGELIFWLPEKYPQKYNPTIELEIKKQASQI